jgi:MFS family permease
VILPASLKARIFGTNQPIAQLLVETRSLRGFADGLVSVVLASYLIHLGFGARQIGVITTMTLIGSAAATMALGLVAHRWSRHALLIVAAVLMSLTGLAFLLVQSFWALLPVAFIGTLNPSSGDVSVFLPLEQAEIAHVIPGHERTRVFARFSLGANLIAALGSLTAGGLAALVATWALDPVRTGQIGFAIYAAIGLFLFARYRRGIPADQAPSPELPPRYGLHRSRAIVFRMAAVFSLDSMGGGFVIQTMLILWLHKRHGMSETSAGLLFTAASLLGAFSMLAAPKLAERIGLVNTMVFTHLPANVFLMLTPFMPNLSLAVAMLLLRWSLSSMDVPARTAFVMSVVEPDERAAAASVTNVPRSLASAVSPAIAGQMLSMTAFGWPLLVGGSLKATYDLILLKMFHDVAPDMGADLAANAAQKSV